jgi:hypothetical protein
VTVTTATPLTRLANRTGGVAGLLLAAGYVVIIGLYSVVGAPPDGDGQAWLDYLAGKQGAWWAIGGLSVATDVLYLPIAGALVLATWRLAPVAVVSGATLLGLFVFLDLAVTWTNYAALIGMSWGVSAGVAGPDLFAAAIYPAAVLASPLFAVYAILVPSLGILLFSIGLLRHPSGRIAGWVGLLTGILGTITVVGAFAVDDLGLLAIPTSVLTAVWVVVVGVGLLRGRYDARVEA